MRAVANKREPFIAVEGDVNYGTLTSKEALDYRQQIIYNSEGMLNDPCIRKSSRKPH